MGKPPQIPAGLPGPALGGGGRAKRALHSEGHILTFCMDRICGFWWQGERRSSEFAPQISPSSRVIMLGLEPIQNWENRKLGANNRPRINSKVSGKGREGRAGKPEIVIIAYKGSVLQSSVFLALGFPCQLQPLCSGAVVSISRS